MADQLGSLFYAGDTLDFTTSVAAYPASAGWTLKYRLAPRVQRQQTEHMKAVIKRFNEQQVTKKVVQVKAETEAVLKEAVATPETLSP